MELFRPSKRILEEISFNDDLPSEILDDEEGHVFTHYGQYITFPPKVSINPFVVGLHAQIAEFYKCGLAHERVNGQAIFNVAGEALKNALWHGAKNKYPVMFGLFLGRNGVCYGVQDNGGYFNSVDIKTRFENKVPITEFNTEFDEVESPEPDRPAHCGGVTNFIYEDSDIIEVDTNNGILYCAQYKERIIFPHTKTS